MSDNNNKDFHAIILTLLGVAALVIFFQFFSDEFSTDSTQQPATAAISQLERGKQVSRNCTACHDLTSARRMTRVGPPLWGIYNERAGSVAGYAYSKAHLQAVEDGLVWTEENLDTYLTNPKAFIPGNRMAFAGIRVDEERAALISYLKSLRDETQKFRDQRPLLHRPPYSQLPDAEGNSYEVRVKRGKIVAEKCGACHDLSPRKKTVIGPPLFGIVGRPTGRVPAFDYSPAFQEKASSNMVWTTRHLDLYLTDPNAFIPGTRMLFAGIGNAQQRSDLITYLRTLK